jgi:serine/threonine-protein kinase RsbW
VPDTVRLSVPSQTAYLRLARLAASSLAAELGFGTDELADLKIAVDEMCALLVSDSDGGDLELTLVTEGDRVVVEGRCDSRSGRPLELHPIAGELLAVIADDCEVGSADGHNHFRVVRRRRHEET